VHTDKIKHIVISKINLNPSMLDEDLKERTKGEHAALEKVFLQIIRGVNSKIEYAALLTKLYGYYNALEKLIHPFLVDSEISDYPQRRKTDRLMEDLSTMDTNPGQIQHCLRLPAVESYHSALGVLYVLEGSTLGGKIIANMIASRLNSETGLRFFLSYGENTMEMWRRFKVYLRQPFTSEQREEIVTSAMLTFVTFKNWLDTDD
jgi:heme oxygenase